MRRHAVSSTLFVLPVNASLEIKLQPSLCYAGSLCLVYGASASLLLLLSLPTALRWGFLVTLGCGLVMAMYRLRSVRRVERLACYGGRWSVVRAGRVWPLRQCDIAYFSNWLIVLRINEVGRRATRLPVFRDGCSGDDFRRLALWLRTVGA